MKRETEMRLIETIIAIVAVVAIGSIVFVLMKGGYLV